MISACRRFHSLGTVQTIDIDAGFFSGLAMIANDFVEVSDAGSLIGKELLRSPHTHSSDSTRFDNRGLPSTVNRTTNDERPLTGHENPGGPRHGARFLSPCRQPQREASIVQLRVPIWSCRCVEINSRQHLVRHEEEAFLAYSKYGRSGS